MGFAVGQGNNDNYWQLYVKDPKQRERAWAAVNSGQQIPPANPAESQGGSLGTAGIQASRSNNLFDKFNAWDAKALTGTQPESSREIPFGGVNPTTEASASGSVNPFSKTPFVSTVPPAQQVAQGGNLQLQRALAGIGTGELSPNVDGDNLKHLAWA